MNELKKILLSLLASFLVMGSLAGCAGEPEVKAEPAVTQETVEEAEEEEAAVSAEEETEAAAEYTMEVIPVTVEGTIFGGSKEPIHMDMIWAPELLTSSDNTKYSPEIAGTAALLCADSYFREKDLAKGRQNRVLVDGEDPEQYTPTSLVKRLGFTEAEYVELSKAGIYTTDTNDLANVLMGYQNVDDKYDLFVFAIRGCFAAQEWLSIFDPGADSEAYTALTGEHPEWLDKNAMKGDFIAADRTATLMQEFMEKNSDASRETVVLLTGHSRGGALANLLGAKLEKDAQVKSFAYTFNTPIVSTSAVPGEHKTVYNIFDANDMFLDPMPFGSENFHRYGTDIALADAELSDAFHELTGWEMPAALSEDDVREFQTMFAARFSDRASLYETRTLKETFADEASAADRREELSNLLGAENGLDLGTFCILGETEKDAEGYALTLTYCDEAWLIAYAKTLSYGTSSADMAAALFAGDEGGLQVLDFLRNHLADISAGHLLVKSALAAQLAR